MSFFQRMKDKRSGQPPSNAYKPPSLSQPAAAATRTVPTQRPRPAVRPRLRTTGGGGQAQAMIQRPAPVQKQAGPVQQTQGMITMEEGTFDSNALRRKATRAYADKKGTIKSLTFLFRFNLLQS